MKLPTLMAHAYTTYRESGMREKRERPKERKRAASVQTSVQGTTSRLASPERFSALLRYAYASLATGIR